MQAGMHVCIHISGPIGTYWVQTNTQSVAAIMAQFLHRALHVILIGPVLRWPFFWHSTCTSGACNTGKADRMCVIA